MNLEQFDVAIDRLDQPAFTRQRMHQPDAAVTNRLCALGDFERNVACAKPPPKTKPKSKRKRGGQPGHEQFERTLIPTADCENVVPCKPDRCRGCGKALRGRDKQPLRQQVWDVEIRPIVTEYQQHRLTCSRCGITTCETLPDSVDGRTGPVLASLLVLMTAWFRTSRRKAALFASDICGV